MDGAENWLCGLSRRARRDVIGAYRGRLASGRMRLADGMSPDDMIGCGRIAVAARGMTVTGIAGFGGLRFDPDLGLDAAGIAADARLKWSGRVADWGRFLDTLSRRLDRERLLDDMARAGEALPAGEPVLYWDAEYGGGKARATVMTGVREVDDMDDTAARVLYFIDLYCGHIEGEINRASHDIIDRIAGMLEGDRGDGEIAREVVRDYASPADFLRDWRDVLGHATAVEIGGLADAATPRRRSPGTR